MSTANKTNRYTLSVKPVDFSLTAGTNIPAPLDSPPQSPAASVRPPTPGGGPLTSHPTTPEDIPGAFPPTPEPEKDGMAKPSTLGNARQERTDSFRTPMTPASASVSAGNHTTSPEPQRRPSTGVRKLLSFSSLRSSFNSSRTSLNTPRASRDQYHGQQPPQQQQQTQQHQYAPYNNLKRPSSPSIVSTTASSYSQSRPGLKTKKSGSWFRRKSGLFLLNDSALDAVDENQRPDTRDSKRLKEDLADFAPPPTLPEVGSLRGGRINNGEIGWDEALFRR